MADGALAIEGLDQAIERVNRYVEAGAEMIFFWRGDGIKSISSCHQNMPCTVWPISNLVDPLFTKDN